MPVFKEVGVVVEVTYMP